MSDIGWLCAKIRSRLKGGDKEVLSRYLRKQGMVVGKDTKTASQLKTSEPYLIRIGNNVTFSTGVTLITHDNSICKIFGVDHDLYGGITIGDNCFIGANATILYGVTLADNVIVAAGSVVTKSVTESEVIIAGNPAKIVGSWQAFGEKNKEHAIHAGHLPPAEKQKKLMNESYRFVVK